MRRKAGTICIILGAALILGALSLFLWNQKEDAQAGAVVEEILPQVVEEIRPQAAETIETVIEDETAVPTPESPEMTEAEIDGYLYVGYISIPALELELPVMSEWDDNRLKIAPCRYAGSTKTDDLVIAAHNYTRHFGNIKSLSIGDTVYFTDMDGVVSSYEVAEIDILNPTDIEAMTDSGFDLTLFTCTYGGQSRVTVRCQRT